MNFAINYSPQAAALLADGQIEIDYFKTPPWPDMIAEAEKLRPITVHFNLRAGSGQLRDTDWYEIERFLDTTPTAHVNLHLALRVKEMPHIPVDAPLWPEHRQQAIERLLEDVQVVTARFGPERVIAENVPYHTGENHNLRACVEPGVISEVIERAGCGLLLDISHARISAHSIGMDAKEYIERLPVHRLRELHFTGIHNWNGYLMDHLPVLEEDWPWLDWVLQHSDAGKWRQAHMLAFEYGGIGNFFEDHTDTGVIAEQVPRIYGMCHKVKT